MLKRRYFEHRGSDGSEPRDRVARAGYKSRLTGENIALGPESAEEVVAGWLDSPGHCANIMEPRFQDIGIGPGSRGLLQAIADSGLRAFAGQCLMDSGDGLPAPMRQPTDVVLAETESLGNRFDGADEHRTTMSFFARYGVEAPVRAIDEVDVRNARRAVQMPCALCPAGHSVTGRIIGPEIRLGLNDPA
jgi:hypothetical protein